MEGKITLITPPDIFENQNQKLLFININDQEQDQVSKWLVNFNLTNDVNFYIYSGETDVPWLFWAIGACDYKYINADNCNEISKSLISYILTKSNVYYKTEDANKTAIYSHINNNKVDSITKFMELSFYE